MHPMGAFSVNIEASAHSRHHPGHNHVKTSMIFITFIRILGRFIRVRMSDLIYNIPHRQTRTYMCKCVQFARLYWEIELVKMLKNIFLLPSFDDFCLLINIVSAFKCNLMAVCVCVYMCVRWRIMVDYLVILCYKYFFKGRVQS